MSDRGVFSARTIQGDESSASTAEVNQLYLTLVAEIMLTHETSMTLLLSLSNRSYAIVLGDRRLAQPDGTVGDDEANKLCVLFCDDARVTIAFTGLASYGGFTTQDWLRDTLYEIGKKTHTLADILRAFQAKASHISLRYHEPLASGNQSRSWFQASAIHQTQRTYAT